MVIDLHGYHPRDLGCDFGVDDGPFQKLVRQAWEMGEPQLTLIHGHGRGRGISPGFVNTNTGYFGLCIRRELRHHQFLRQWIMHTTQPQQQKKRGPSLKQETKARSRMTLDGQHLRQAKAEPPALSNGN